MPAWGQRQRDREGGKSRWEIRSLALVSNSGDGQHQFGEPGQ